MGQVGVSPELELPREGRCKEETCSQDQERDPVSPAQHRLMLPAPGSQEGVPAAPAWPVPLPWAPSEAGRCCCPRAVQTQSKAQPEPPPLVPRRALGNSFPFRGAGGLFPRLKLSPKPLTNLKNLLCSPDTCHFPIVRN